MNIAVVDDEEIVREQIGGFIKKRNPDFNISAFATGEELLAAGTGFDIIFLDIQMEGMGGIEAARTLRQSGVDAVIIFITEIKEFVFEAFDVSAFHYLLKPAEMRQFEAEQAAKKKRREEYARLNEESALKRKLLEQETDERYYQTSITKKAVSNDRGATIKIFNGNGD